MFIFLLVISGVGSFNINTNKYSVLDGHSDSGEFGFSLAVTADHLFVAAPKDEDGKGALYRCDRTLEG